MSKFSPRQWALATAVIFVLFTVLCFPWQLIITDPVLRELHVSLLRLSFPGFQMNPAGFAIAVVESALFGLLSGWIFAKLLNIFNK